MLWFWCVCKVLITQGFKGITLTSPKLRCSPGSFAFAFGFSWGNSRGRLKFFMISPWLSNGFCHNT